MYDKLLVREVWLATFRHSALHRAKEIDRVAAHFYNMVWLKTWQGSVQGVKLVTASWERG